MIDHESSTPKSTHDCSCDCETSSIQAEPVLSANLQMQYFRIANMDCAAEESEIRRALEGLSDIRSLQFNLSARVLGIDANDASITLAITAIKKAGFKPEPMNATASGDHVLPASTNGWSSWGKQIVALLLAIAAEGLAFAFKESLITEISGMVLAAMAIWLAGFDVYGKGLAALLQRRLNINALMTVAVTGAFLIGQWPEAAMVMALYAIAEAIEAKAVDRARNAIKSLMALAPDQAEVRQSDGSWSRIETPSVSVGATVRVNPGERIPLDGVVLSGQSAVDQSSLTGESLPVDKGPADEVYAGTINQAAALELRVTAPASGSTLSRIITAVEQAQGTRAPTQRFVDRFAAIYTPAVFLIALAVVLVTPLLMHWTWLQALYKALVLLVIACPCALVISTPVTVVSGLATAARRGILIKGGVYLEQARAIKAVALDKTGTITEGKPQLIAFDVVDATISVMELERMAKSLASRSDHPVSKAIANGLQQTARDEVIDFKAVAGRGVQGIIANKTIVLGNHRWIVERQQCSPQLEASLKAHEEAGRTVTLLADDSHVLAICAVADTIKPSSAQAISELKSLGVTPVMLTGDNLATAKTVAAEAGIEEVNGNLLPEDKLQAIASLQRHYGITAMTGDGINDAPALAKSDIGFAMGAVGTHTAMEAADVLIMNDDLRRLPETIRLSKRTHIILWQNIALALGIKLAFLLLAIFDNATMWMAVFADMGASLLVVFNGLRLLNGARIK